VYISEGGRKDSSNYEVQTHTLKPNYSRSGKRERERERFLIRDDKKRNKDKCN